MKASLKYGILYHSLSYLTICEPFFIPNKPLLDIEQKKSNILLDIRPLILNFFSYEA